MKKFIPLILVAGIIILSEMKKKKKRIITDNLLKGTRGITNRI